MEVDYICLIEKTDQLLQEQKKITQNIDIQADCYHLRRKVIMIFNMQKMSEPTRLDLF